MKPTPNLQRLARQAFGEVATVQHRRYGPGGEKREGYWLHLGDDMRYLAYSRQQTIDYLTQVILEHSLNSPYQHAA